MHRRVGGRRWRRLATVVLARAAGHCEGCGRKAKLSAHHARVLVVTGSQELTTADELLALCSACQARERPATLPSRPN